MPGPPCVSNRAANREHEPSTERQAPGTPYSRLSFVVDRGELDQLELAGAAGRGDLDLIAFLLVEDGFSDGRGRGDHPLLRVGFLGHDELVHDGVAALVAKVHRRAEAGTIAWNAIEVYHRNLAHPLLEHRDARVDDILPVLGSLVLRVLAQIAKLARPLDLLRQIHLQLALEGGDLVVETLDDSFFHRLNQTLAQRRPPSRRLPRKPDTTDECPAARA